MASDVLSIHSSEGSLLLDWSEMNQTCSQSLPDAFLSCSRSQLSFYSKHPVKFDKPLARKATESLTFWIMQHTKYMFVVSAIISHIFCNAKGLFSDTVKSL